MRKTKGLLDTLGASSYLGSREKSTAATFKTLTFTDVL